MSRRTRPTAYVGRADLLHLLAQQPDAELDPFAALLGLAPRPTCPRPSIREPERSEAGTWNGQMPGRSLLEPAGLPVDVPRAPVPLWRPDAYELVDDVDQPEPAPPPPPIESLPPPIFDPLAGPSRLRALLFSGLTTLSLSSKVDVDAVVRAWSRGRLLTSWPRRKSRRWPRRLELWRDRCPPLVPLAEDQAWVSEWLRAQLGRGAVKSRSVDEAQLLRPAALAAQAEPDTVLLVLSDLGAYGDPSRRDAWVDVGRGLVARGVQALALLPVPPDCWPSLEKAWRLVPWEPSAGRAFAEPARNAKVQTLLAYLSLAARMESGLVRSIRRLPEFDADVGIEVGVWAHDDVVARVAGLGMAPDACRAWRARLRERLPLHPGQTLKAVFREIRRWHRGRAPRGVWETELLAAASLGRPGVVSELELEHARFALRTLLDEIDGGKLTSEQEDAVYEWTSRVLVRDAAALRDHAPSRDSSGHPLLELVASMRGREPHIDLPEGVGAEAWEAAKRRRPDSRRVRRWNLVQTPCGLQVDLDDTGSPLLTVEARAPSVSVEGRASWGRGQGMSYGLRRDSGGVHHLTDLFRPAWADCLGWDGLGPWVEVRVRGVSFRMRWIEPGEFLMGSPSDEPGRESDDSEWSEVQHRVALTEGFWIAETPCTQALWRAVRGENPSAFPGDDRPVESVSWEDAQAFIREVNSERPELALRLPSEAQWEYACRAGETASTYVGALTLREDGRRADELESIAWYNGNSGGQPHPVARKTPNVWGLHDSLGNVWEWCQDWLAPYGEARAIDRMGPEVGTERVLRGGSWNFDARNVRAATRFAFDPSYRSSSVGFRLSRGPEQEPSDGRSPAATQGGARGARAEPRPGAPRDVDFEYDANRVPVIWIPNRDADDAPVVKPEWAEEVSRDRFGLWALMRVRTKRSWLRRSVVDYRFRWMRRGSFMMGSPEEEAGHLEREGPQHHVTLTKGFWLGETLCTQALWAALMPDHPSTSTSRDRLNQPVVKVSWEDTTTFFTHVNGRFGDGASLPTEAQWEYACRAGTVTATWIGNLRFGQDGMRAPELDAIAWYSANTSVGAMKVAGKRVNPAGLYDMLGNVWEWCQDRYGPYDSGPAIDPIGPSMGSGRVLRGGGSWLSLARGVRAAARDALDPSYRVGDVGFRLSRGQGSQVAVGRSPIAQGPGTEPRPGARRAREIPSVHIVTDRMKAQLSVIERPAWAHRMGRDRYGLFADVQVPHRLETELPVRFRLRWIPPGRFMMGSPREEVGRWDPSRDAKDWSEETRKTISPEDLTEEEHEVALTRGFWMADRPVTQTLWTALQESNPSRFVDPERPVEQVSWDDAQAFIRHLNEAVSDLRLCLPSEAQWEYACRAGTTTATYAGELDLQGANSAPVLDQIAWYGGNSGSGFDLEDGYDSSGWAEKQYDHSVAGTRKVTTRLPNAWGLYDTLGNVWEWCQDWVAPYGSSAIEEPMGPDMGSVRVLRGGSWDSDARFVRAAMRGAYGPSLRDDFVGFRLSRGQD